MIETPRAALVADEIAEVAEFFSFGTNDLTQMTFGFSRDDIEGRFMSEYLEYKLLPANPFETLDVEGVGQLCAWASSGVARRAPTSSSVSAVSTAAIPRRCAFCHEVGLDYVSCSPYRVPDRPPRGRARRDGAGWARHVRVKQRLSTRADDHRVPQRGVPRRDGSVRDRGRRTDDARASACTSASTGCGRAARSADRRS